MVPTIWWSHHTHYDRFDGSYPSLISKSSDLRFLWYLLSFLLTEHVNMSLFSLEVPNKSRVYMKRNHGSRKIWRPQFVEKLQKYILIFSFEWRLSLRNENSHHFNDIIFHTDYSIIMTYNKYSFIHCKYIFLLYKLTVYCLFQKEIYFHTAPYEYTISPGSYYRTWLVRYYWHLQLFNLFTLSTV